MIIERQKYRSTLCQVAGFALMSPVGKVILDSIESRVVDLSIKFWINLGVSLLFFIAGIILMVIGDMILSKE